MINKQSLAIIAILMFVGTAAAVFTAAQIDINPLEQDINIGSVGHYTLTLTTNDDAKGGTLTWSTDDPHLLANINGAPTSQNGGFAITTSSTCTGSGSSKVCKQNFDLQASPQSGVTVGVRSITITVLNQQFTAKAMVTGGVNPVPEIPAGILTAAGLLGLLGLVMYKKR